jgi:myo-inositol 2-dehydrogenase/D-chiro-inositol 1-dehydrogenase
MRELRVALLGQGFMGKAHSNAFAQVGHFYDAPFRVRRALLCGRDVDTLKTMASRWEWEETTTDWRTAIDRKDIDLVDVALPNHLHAEAAMAAAQAGKIVFCEKPLSLTVAEGEAMVAAAKNVRSMVWYNYRRVPAIAFAHELIRAGRLGTIYHYDAAYRQQWGPDRSRDGTWKMDPAQAGSGVADDLLTHLLDTALYLNGPVSEGFAARKTFAPGRAIDDAFLALLRFANGSIGQFQATRFGIGCRNANSFQIHGSGGMLRFNLERLNNLEFADANDPAVDQGTRDILVTDMKHPVFPHFWRPAHIIGYEHTFIAALGEFLEALDGDAEFHPDFADGLAVQRILSALQQSAQTGSWTPAAQ